MSYYPIELDKSRNLKYGMRAISIVEKKFKKPMAKIDMDNLTMDEIAVLVWAGLVHEDKNLTSDRVMDLIDEHSSIKIAMGAMGEALNGAFGENEEEEEKND